ncbi:MAG: transposase [Candidatus Omnitrophica bacterium]|nr:transposase [Candidatus Omnitrophota bacterium]
MPRTKRLIPVNLAMHIICRGNNGQKIFYQEKDKRYYYDLLKNLKEVNKIKIFHYCLMDNHMHLIVWLSLESSVSKFMKQVNLCYFNYFKKTYGYCGHLWQGRFKSNVVDTDSYLLQCGKYIELNPVRATMVGFPEEYRFSSYNHYAKGKSDPLVTDSFTYMSLSNDSQSRMKQYIEFVVDESIINAELFARQQFIGGEVFIKKLQDYYGIRNKGLKRGRPKGQKGRKNRNVPFFIL